MAIGRCALEMARCGLSKKAKVRKKSGLLSLYIH
jgi:hypothetical protein